MWSSHKLSDDTKPFLYNYQYSIVQTDTCVGFFWVRCFPFNIAVKESEFVGQYRWDRVSQTKLCVYFSLSLSLKEEVFLTALATISTFPIIRKQASGDLCKLHTPTRRPTNFRHQATHTYSQQQVSEISGGGEESQWSAVGVVWRRVLSNLGVSVGPGGYAGTFTDIQLGGFLCSHRSCDKEGN